MHERLEEMQSDFTLQEEMEEQWGKKVPEGAEAMAGFIRTMPAMKDSSLVFGVSGYQIPALSIANGLEAFAHEYTKNRRSRKPDKTDVHLNPVLEAATIDLRLQNGVDTQEEGDALQKRLDVLTLEITANDPPTAMENMKERALDLAGSVRSGIISGVANVREMGVQISIDIQDAVEERKLGRLVMKQEKKNKEEGLDSSESFVSALMESMPVFDSVYNDGGFEHPRTKFHASITNLIQKGWFKEIKFSNWKAAVLSKPEKQVVTDVKLKNGNTLHLDTETLERELPRSKDQLVSLESAFYAVSKSEAQLKSALEASDVAYRVSYKTEAEKGVKALIGKTKLNGEETVDTEVLKLEALKDIRQAIIKGEIASARPGVKMSLNDLEKQTEKHFLDSGLSKAEAALVVLLVFSYVMSACSSPSTTPTLGSETTVPGPEIDNTPVAPEPTAAVVLSPTANPVPNSVDFENIDGVDFLQDLDVDSTVVVESTRGFYTTFYGVESPDELSPEKQLEAEAMIDSMAGQVAYTISRSIGYETYYVDSFIGAGAVLAKLEEYGIENVTILDYKAGGGEDSLFVSVHASSEGWNVIGWNNGTISQDNGGLYYVNGLILSGIDTDGNGTSDSFVVVPAQKFEAFGARPIITREGTIIVKVDNNGEILEVLNSNILKEDGQDPWQTIKEATTPKPSPPDGSETPPALVDEIEAFVGIDLQEFSALYGDGGDENKAAIVEWVKSNWNLGEKDTVSIVGDNGFVSINRFDDETGKRETKFYSLLTGKEGFDTRVAENYANNNWESDPEWQPTSSSRVTVMGHVEGLTHPDGTPMDIPISIGAIESSDIDRIVPSQYMADALARGYLEAYKARYEMQNGTEITWDEYLQLLQQGKGAPTVPQPNEDAAPNAYRKYTKDAQFNPLAGVAMVFVDTRSGHSNLPVKIAQGTSLKNYIDENGRLVINLNYIGMSISYHLAKGEANSSIVGDVTAQEIFAIDMTTYPARLISSGTDVCMLDGSGPSQKCMEIYFSDKSDQLVKGIKDRTVGARKQNIITESLLVDFQHAIPPQRF